MFIDIYLLHYSNYDEIYSPTVVMLLRRLSVVSLLQLTLFITKILQRTYIFCSKKGLKQVAWSTPQCFALNTAKYLKRQPANSHAMVTNLFCFFILASSTLAIVGGRGGKFCTSYIGRVVWIFSDIVIHVYMGSVLLWTFLVDCRPANMKMSDCRWWIMFGGNI